MTDFESPKMSPELMGAISKVESLERERDRIERVLQSERKRFRDQQVNYEEARLILSATESDQALSGGAPDPQFRRNFAAARDELDMLGARIEGVSARFAVVERDLVDAREQLSQTFEQWSAAESARSADRLAVAMQPFIEALKREYGVAVGLNDKGMLVALRAFVLPNPRDPGRPLFHGSSNLRAGRFRSDASASQLADNVGAIRLKVAGLLGAHARQAEVVDVPIEEEITK